MQKSSDSEIKDLEIFIFENCIENSCHFILRFLVAWLLANF